MRLTDFVVFIVLIISCINTCAQDKIDLSGTWRFGILADEKDVNLPPKNLTESICLPGSMMQNGKGDPVTVDTRWVGSIYDSSYYFNPAMEKYRRADNVKFPFFLTPPRHFVGKAWYVRSIRIPKQWKGQHVELYLERPHIVSKVWVNGSYVGEQNSLCVAHIYDVSKYVSAGNMAEIAILIGNDPSTVGVGDDSHSVSDQTQGCWNGIVGEISLRLLHKKQIVSADVYPNVASKSIDVILKTSNKLKRATLRVSPYGTDEIVAEKQIKLSSDSSCITIPMGADCKLWDELSPNLYMLSITTDDDEKLTTVFGMREFKIDGRKFTINGRQTMLRGTVENCDFPLTGYAPTDLESWLKIFRKCKAYGLNHMRFHSYCPPEAAFLAADIEGFYLQPECPSWPNHGVSLGRGEKVDKYLMDEAERITAAYGNHPSFVMLAAGNEPRGNWVKWCSNFVNIWKNRDSRRVYTGASVGGGWQWQPASQYHVKAGARGLSWGKHRPSTTDNYTDGITRFYDKATKQTFEINEPFVTHEMGQWCAFPDIADTVQFTGVYKERNFEIFSDILVQNGMADMSNKFLMSSGKLQLLCYKYEIERLMRTPDYAGYQLLALNDYSGQGSAIVGLLNVLWNEKGYCSAEDFRQFCNPVVMLAEFPKFTFTAGEEVRIPIKIANYNIKPIDKSSVYYTIKVDNMALINGNIDMNHLDCGITELDEIVLSTSDFNEAVKATLTVSLGSECCTANNSWDFWIYPKLNPQADNDIYVTDTLDAKARETLQNGGKVLLLAGGKVTYGSDVKQQFLPVFWNTSWFKMRPPHTVGSYIQSSHPIFSDFPTDDYTSLQWWELVNNTQCMLMKDFSTDLKPIVQPIDTWFLSRRLSTLFEANVLNGKLIVTTFNLTNDLDNRPAARQLLQSIYNYMHSAKFEPQSTVYINDIEALFTKQSERVDMYTKDSPDELKPKIL
ncbi:MAG: beta-glucuronidase [Bacteroidales bacterium]|nr:beta-glucuronidase [Bacteroidales bacterium]